MSGWLPIIHGVQPEGDGAVVAWCSNTDWTDMLHAEALRDPNFNSGYNFTMFKYVDHPFPVPEDHGFFSFSTSIIPKASAHDSLTQIVGPRAMRYEDFVNDLSYGYYAGKLGGEAQCFFAEGRGWTFLFRTEEDLMAGRLSIDY